MNIQKYQAFITVVEQGSLTKAAEELGCTQSAVSHSISGLEEELGFALLKRSRAGIRLTGEGERMISPVRDLLGSAERLKQTASSIRGLESGTVRIGAFTSVAVHWLPAVLKEFQQDYPRVDFRLLNGDYHDVEQWLREGSVDLGFITLPGPAGMRTIPLAEDPLVAILPKGHRLAALSQIPIEELREDPFISLLQSSAHDIHRALDNAGIRPNIKYTTKDDYAILAMVEQGLGISIVPQLLIRGRTQNLEVRPLIPKASRTIALAIPEGEALPVVRAFAETAVGWLKSADSVTQTETPA